MPSNQERREKNTDLNARKIRPADQFDLRNVHVYKAVGDVENKTKQRSTHEIQCNHSSSVTYRNGKYPMRLPIRPFHQPFFSPALLNTST